MDKKIEEQKTENAETKRMPRTLVVAIAVALFLIFSIFVFTYLPSFLKGFVAVNKSVEGTNEEKVENITAIQCNEYLLNETGNETFAYSIESYNKTAYMESRFLGEEGGYYVRQTDIKTESGNVTMVITMDKYYRCVKINTIALDATGAPPFSQEVACSMEMRNFKICKESVTFAGENETTTPIGTFKAKIYTDDTESLIWVAENMTIPLKIERKDGTVLMIESYAKQ